MASTERSSLNKVILLCFLIPLFTPLNTSSHPTRRLMKSQEASMAANLTKSKTKPLSIETYLGKVNKSKTSPKTQLKKLNSTYSTIPSSNSTKKSLDLLKIDREEVDSTDFISEFLPDLEKISTTSKAYLTRANNQITIGVKPIVGNKYASAIAPLVSFSFILIPFIFVSLLINRVKAYFSLQKLLIFIQAYLSIYFSILSLSSLLTGLEPLRFLHTSSPSTYVCLQLMQTMGYVLYLLMLLMYLVLVFSTDNGIGSKMIALGQTFVGYSVGVHYYVTVSHRTVLHLPPRTSWIIHLIYATCFLVVCVAATVDRRKKSYLEDGGAEGKQS